MQYWIGTTLLALLFVQSTHSSHLLPTCDRSKHKKKSIVYFCFRFSVAFVGCNTHWMHFIGLHNGQFRQEEDIDTDRDTANHWVVAYRNGHKCWNDIRWSRFVWPRERNCWCTGKSILFLIFYFCFSISSPFTGTCLCCWDDTTSPAGHANRTLEHSNQFGCAASVHVWCICLVECHLRLVGYNSSTGSWLHDPVARNTKLPRDTK